VGIIDMSSFGKVEITGQARLRFLSVWRATDRPAGGQRRLQTQPQLSRRGGVAAGVTVTRLADDHSGWSPAPAT
jgi:glycine cleavage system aminomethyltransferase T